MAITAKVFGNFLLKALNKEVSMTNGCSNLKVMLCTSGYSPDQDAHMYKNQVTNEVVGEGYSAGGKILTSVSINYDANTNTIKLDASDVVWNTSTITARYAVIYDSTQAADTAKCLIGYVDFGTNVSSYSGDFSLIWDANGILSIISE